MNPRTGLPYPATLEVAREWWLVTRPDGKTVEVCMCPPCTEREMRALYPGCGVQEVA